MIACSANQRISNHFIQISFSFGCRCCCCWCSGDGCCWIGWLDADNFSMVSKYFSDSLNILSTTCFVSWSRSQAEDIAEPSISNQQQPSSNPPNQQTLHSEYQTRTRKQKELQWDTDWYSHLYRIKWIDFDAGSVWFYYHQQEPTEPASSDDEYDTFGCAHWQSISNSVQIRAVNPCNTRRYVIFYTFLSIIHTHIVHRCMYCTDMSELSLVNKEFNLELFGWWCPPKNGRKGEKGMSWWAQRMDIVWIWNDYRITLPIMYCNLGFVRIWSDCSQQKERKKVKKWRDHTQPNGFEYWEECICWMYFFYFLFLYFCKLNYEIMKVGQSARADCSLFATLCSCIIKHLK